MKRALAIASLLWLVGCGSDEPAAAPGETGEPFIQPDGCEALRCDLGCIQDETGAARCACDLGEFGDDCHPCPAGQQDWDDDGVCTIDCLTAALTCGSGYCDDTLGTAQCVCPLGAEGEACERCSAGYQDHDGDGLCSPSCTLGEVVCDRGTCDDASGAAVCVCEADWAGVLCDVCAEGLQDHDFDGVCLPNCAAAALACENGECVDASGTARCACFAGWEGEACDQCRDGLSDSNGDGMCTAEG